MECAGLRPTMTTSAQNWFTPTDPLAAAMEFAAARTSSVAEAGTASVPFVGCAYGSFRILAPSRAQYGALIARGATGNPRPVAEM